MKLYSQFIYPAIMMDEQRAKLMLREIFTNRFDNDNFILFVKELFNRFDYDRRDAKQEDISKDFQEFIDSFSSFGRYEDSEKKFVEILSVKLKKSNPESARTMQRNFIAKYLTQHNTDAALVAFYGDEIDNWRLSFVKLEYHLEKDDKGNVKPVSTITPPKRYSFLVGKTEPSHTAQSRFLELLLLQNNGLTTSEIETSFSVEKVTKEFFGKYKELFLELEEAMNHIVEQNKNLAKEFNEKGISTVDFAKKLLGQIVFIYFLQKKGWLGIEKDNVGKFKEWGTGHKDFLRRLYNKDIVDYSNFFNDILEPLFYEALAKDRTTENDYYSRFSCKIPFLNGGLFEPLGEYDWTNVDILLDDRIFGKIIDTFDLYNFTVKEDEPLEKEVAIDPEMLGNIFENLLEIKDRKSKGSYYTPREIVYYMCRESLINYLETRAEIEKKDIDDFIYNGQISSQIRDNRDKIDKLLKDIKVVDPAIGSGAFLVGMMAEIIKSRATLTKLFPKAEQLERTLYNFKRECIEDSLYGVDIDSGAVDIAQLRLWLSLIVDETDIHKIKPLPNLDYKIMCGNSLLDEFEGVKLFDERLIGEIKKEDYSEEIGKIEENIEKLYKELGMITTGKKKDYGMGNVIKKEIDKLKKKKQKLIATPQKKGTYGSLSEANRIKESQKKLKQIQALHKQFFNENNRKVKIELRKEIERLDWEFIEETLKEQGNEEAKKKIEQIKRTRSKPFFLWKLYFAGVFQENGGFDVVIANPPYIRVQELKHEDVDFFKEKYKFAYKRLDISLLFFERGLNLLNSNGILTFISSNQFLLTEYGEKARENLGPLTKSIINFDSLPIFENALTYASIFLIKKTNTKYLEYIKIESLKDFGLKELKFNMISKRNLVGNHWILDYDEDLALLNKLRNGAQKLGDVAKTHYGIISGKDDIFILNKRKILELKIEKEYIRSIIIPEAIFKWGLDELQYFVIYPYLFNKNTVLETEEALKNNSPNLYSYLKLNKIKLEERKDSRSTFIGRSGWYRLVRSSSIDIFESEKIISPTIVKRNKFALDTQKNAFSGGKTVAIISKSMNNRFLLAILNSKLAEYYYQKSTPSKAGGYHNYSATFLLELPIKIPDNQETFLCIVDQILTIIKSQDYLKNNEKQAKVKNLEDMLDQLIYDLYNLNSDEIKIIETFCNKEIVNK